MKSMNNLEKNDFKNKLSLLYFSLINSLLSWNKYEGKNH
jgi:hypothetical protein